LFKFYSCVSKEVSLFGFGVIVEFVLVFIAAKITTKQDHQNQAWKQKVEKLEGFT